MAGKHAIAAAQLLPKSYGKIAVMFFLVILNFKLVLKT